MQKSSNHSSKKEKNNKITNKQKQNKTSQTCDIYDLKRGLESSMFCLNKIVCEFLLNLSNKSDQVCYLRCVFMQVKKSSCDHGSKKCGIENVIPRKFCYLEGNFDFFGIKKYIRNSGKLDHIPGKFAFFRAVLVTYL